MRRIVWPDDPATMRIDDIDTRSIVMKINPWILASAMAIAAGMGMSVATTSEAAVSGCERRCRAEYTQCWYSCTPGDGPCYTQCQANYYDCSAGCGT